MVKKLLTIAGSDCSGGAGIQADIKTFSSLGAYAMSIICSVTAQNTTGVFAIADIPKEIVKSQLDAVFSDIQVDAVKLGMISNNDNVDVIADALTQYAPPHIVIDPVMISTSGHTLLNENAIDGFIKKLLPLATVVTPNIPEAELLADMKIITNDDTVKALHIIHNKGADNVLIKGGHSVGEPIDYLLYNDNIYTFIAPRINTKNTHGTGCTLSSAIATFLSYGLPLNEAVQKSKDYLTNALKYSYDVGHGHGPVNHFWNK